MGGNEHFAGIWPTAYLNDYDGSPVPYVCEVDITICKDLPRGQLAILECPGTIFSLAGYRLT